MLGPDRGDPKLGDVVPGKRGCRKAPGREERGEGKELLLADAQTPEIPPSAYSGMLLSSKWLEHKARNWQETSLKKARLSKALNTRLQTSTLKATTISTWSLCPSYKAQLKYHLFQKPILNMLKEIALSSLSLQFAFLGSLFESQLLHPENMINITYLKVFLWGLNEITFIKCQVAVFSTQKLLEHILLLPQFLTIRNTSSCY